MKILVCGDRNWTNRELIAKVLAEHLHLGLPELVIIEGEAQGADTIAREVAELYGLKVMKFPADWNKYGRSAGPIRNRQMLDEKPDLVIAFHPNLANSKGTKDCVTEARKRGIPTEVYK